MVKIQASFFVFKSFKNAIDCLGKNNLVGVFSTLVEANYMTTSHKFQEERNISKFFIFDMK